ncbi:hypothetical protein [Stenotrophomonas sp.]|uniref:hypothetical protein n=1 Tax=Stenotrophomonas sp. TaxID=69392 RepID=UPI0028994006|nr:hypothetical protein [Stenotrophomonas sp.]
MDFKAFSISSKFAADINAGYSACLAGKRLSDNPHIHWITLETEDGAHRKAGPLNDKAQAWQHGWRQADDDEKGRGGAR